MEEPLSVDLYEGSNIYIHYDGDANYETVTIHLNNIAITLDKDGFQELYNAVFMAKTVLKDLEDKK